MFGRNVIIDFCDIPNEMTLAFNDSIQAMLQLPKKLPRQKMLLMMKTKSGKLGSAADCQKNVVFMDMIADPLEHLERVVQEIYLPLLSNANNQEGWGEVASKEIMDQMHGFLASVSITLGQTKGKTCLPLPPMETANTEGVSVDTKDRIHLLEGAVITWTKQIKNVLKSDPEGLLKQGLHPTPNIEIEFWKSKAANLNAIFDQLQSERIRRVLKFLDKYKSTYCNPFAKLCKEVFTARLEANDNVKYLRTLEAWFQRLNDCDDFPELVELFKPMMHILLLIWKNSKYYNSPARLVVLMREICNALINQACKYVSGKQIFDLIADEDAGTAVEQLKTTLKVCGTFKSTYFDYKATANAECPTNPWEIQNNALFMRLDSFLERCHDILDLTQTIVQFSKLAKIEIGGTKGKTLTNSVAQIYVDFDQAVETFKAVPYDIMDVSRKEFDDDFYEFRCRIKELERRLGSVLTQGFDDCATIYGRFKLLDSFEGLLERPIIQDELEKKHIALVQAYGADLKQVQELFLTERESPPIPNNFPPIAGALTWCRGLKERIQEPMAKLKQLNKTIMQREEAKEVVKVYSTIISSLTDYEHQKIEEWGSDVERSSQAKLKLPILARGANKSDHREISKSLLSVNFDPALVRLLREVKYFLLLNLDVPDSALLIFKKGETYRRQTGNLDLIVNMYNQMMVELLPVEAPLLRKHLAKIDAIMQPGLRDMNWKSQTINDFIEDSNGVVKAAYDLLYQLKGNLKSVESILATQSEAPLVTRKPKPVRPHEFKQTLEGARRTKYQAIKAGGAEIVKKVKASHVLLKVPKGQPDWRAYVDFCNNIVVEGTAKVVKVSLTYLSEQLSFQAAMKKEALPMLEIELQLRNNEVDFFPPLGETADQSGVRDIINEWVDSFYHVATIMNRLDDADGRYVREMVDDVQIRLLLATIERSMAMTHAQCLQFREQYTQHSYLWTTNQHDMFAAFVEEAYDETESGQKIPNLEKFQAEITKYKGVLATIQSLQTPTDIGWLRVNSQPIKQSLATMATQWIYMFTNHLVDHVVASLQDLHDFMARVDTGLEEVVEEDAEDVTPLKRCMAHIRDVRKAQPLHEESFEPLRAAVALLKSHSVTFEDRFVNGAGGLPAAEGEGEGEGEDATPAAVERMDVVEYLDAAPMKWEATVNKTYSKKEEIFPMQTAETEHVKNQVRGFFERMRQFRTGFRKTAPSTFLGAADEAYAQIDKFEQELQAFEAESKDVNNLEELFELAVSQYSEMEDTRNELRMLKMLWDFRSLVLATFESWKSQLWSEIDTDALEGNTRKLAQYIKKMGDQNSTMKGWVTYRDTETTVKNMTITLPLVNDLHSPAMRPRHWKNMAHVCHSKPLDPNNPKFCLDDLLSLQLHTHADDVADVVETASKELKIERKLQGIEATWADLMLEYLPHKDSDVYVVKVSDEVVEALEEHQMELQTIVGMGKYVDYFRDRVTLWQKNLGNVETVLKEWISVTKAWASLESIFLGSADIRAQLPDDTKRFEGIDQEFKDLMKAAVEEPNVVNACIADGRDELLKGMTKNLELCQKSLNEYLDMKKKIFPRFYFVSNVALLDILSNGNNPPRIMPYLGDCYDSIANLTFEEQMDKSLPPNVTVQMTAKDGEVVDFQTPFVIKGAVEDWLNELTEKQQDTLGYILEQAVDTAVNWDVEKPRHVWLNDYPAQVVLVGTLIYWTEETQAALEELESGAEDAVKKYYNVCNDRLMKLIELVLGRLEPDLRTKIISLITMDVHSRDVVQALIDGRAEGPLSFDWAKQLRFYWQPEKRGVQILITDFKGDYSYEWVGNSGRLVITPLTDRCYITLTMAMRLMLGGAPAGPAGTGKTETVKDLARAVAVPCYVFNCSDQMNYQTMADIFKGLSQTGGWGCFDEFNRISIEVLSVVATQVKQAQDAIVLYSVVANREEKYQHLPAGTPNKTVGHFELAGDLISLVPTVGFFITMNPGYAGRTELPENLKALFRSCAMIRPDLALICENMLMSEGFGKARPLSVKFVTLYQLCGELLSPQHHYDWGLRAVKSVLRVAGALKRAEPEVAEEAVLLRALRDFNTPKMPSSDLPIFLRLIQDLFPLHYQIPTKMDESLRDKAIEACKLNKLQPEPGFIAKVVQFQELLDVRHSVMLLGPAGSGKTCIWKMLCAVHNLGLSKAAHIYNIVNPKAVDTSELYGYMTLSKDWKDGVLSIIMRGMSKNYKELGYHEYQVSKWVVLDGDIDTLWIESMNTVMDDNKVLTLVSNERIPLSKAMRMVFEIDAIDNASPATVSRAGMLYINDTDVGWRPFVDSWLDALPEELQYLQSRLPPLFDKYIEAVQEATPKKDFRQEPAMVLINKVASTCYLLEGLLPQLDPADDADMLEAQFAVAVMWAFGGTMIPDKNGNWPKNFSDVMDSTMGVIKFPKEDGRLCFDFFFDRTAEREDGGQGAFVLWDTRVPEFEPVPVGYGPGETPFSKLVVQTVDSVRLTYLMDLMVQKRHPIMFVGTAGTGKTTLIKNYLAQLDSDKELFDVINMNYYMDSKALQQLLEAPIDKRSGRIFGPPTGKTLVYYVDDVNLPYIETYGTQNSLSLLRQIMTHSTFFDRSDLGLLKEITDVKFVASMNPTAGSFQITQRLQWRFFTIAMRMPNEADLRGIYLQTLAGHLATFDTSISAAAGKIVDASIRLHTLITARFLPSATRFVYNWNMRELSRVTQGLMMAQPSHFRNATDFVRLWVHECSRVFRDRLVNDKDMETYDNFVKDTVKACLGDVVEAEATFAEPNIFTSFAAQTSADPAYMPLPVGETGMEVLSRTLADKLDEYNSTNSIMNLVLFEQAMEHVCRISRIIYNPGGNAMLVGVGGSGKQSLSRLASSICGYEVKQLQVTSKFTVLDLREELKAMYRTAGIKAIGTVFLLTDTQIVDDRFLVYVNDMLSSGWVTGLFEKDEMEGIYSGVRSDAKAQGVADTPDSLTDFFIQRIRQNLHIVLCFSPVGQTFRVRARRFPGLINCTAIDWFHAWPRTALVSVASQFLDDVELGEDSVKESVAQHMAFVHTVVTEQSTRYLAKQRRYNYVTPKSFLELIAFYKHLLAQKRKEIELLVQRLDVGLSTLRKTADDVNELQVDLKHTMVKVAEKVEATEVLLKRMGVERAEAEKQQEIANVEAEKADKAASDAAKIETEAATELAQAEPAMIAAAAAVDCLSKASLTELKGFSSPPSGVDKVTACCLMMLEGEFKNHKWDRAKKMMGKVDAFLQKLKVYDAENMDEKLIKRLEPFVQDPDFNQEVMSKKSDAAANLCTWVVNIYTYNRIYVRVKPLMDALESARAKKAAAQASLDAAQAVVEKVEKALKALQDSLVQATEEKQAVEEMANQCNIKLGLAQRLVNGLASENERWGREIEMFKQEERTLVGDVLLASSFVSYIGAFDHVYRNNLWRTVWMDDLIERQIPLSEGVDPLKLLTDDGNNARMMNEGLPADRISIENGSIINASQRWPLLIDPQLQGIKWLRRKEAENNLKVIQLTQPNWIRHVVNAVSQGHVIVVENLGEDVDATLDPVLARAVYKRGRSLYLRVGADEVEYDQKFRLYLQTKLTNPHYKPEIQAQCTLVNFIATEKGLQDQLLAKVVNREKRELEEEKQRLQEAFNQYKIKLLDLENQLLERLANAPEDILSDVPLIEGLEATKKAATEIGKAVKKGKETEIAINKARNEYIPVAQEGAMLYFMITQLDAVEHMYQYSLDAFVLYFYKAIEAAPKSEKTAERVHHLRECLRLTIFRWVARGLFERHKLILLAQLAFQLMRRGQLAEEFDLNAFNFLVRGPTKAGEANPIDWLPDPAWNATQALAEMDEFAKFPTDMTDAPQRFREWFTQVTPETEKLPLDWSGLDKTPFKKLLVLRCLRPDRLTVALTNFTRTVLPHGSDFVECDATLSSVEILDASVHDSVPATPIYFILSPGSDVVGDLDRLASKYGFVKGVSYHNVSMGQGQDVVAMDKLEMGHKQGHWVILNNIHLMPRWCVELEKKLDSFQVDGSHPKFRVFLTSEPSSSIPIGILNRSIKLTNEPPTGLKANLKRAFCSFTKSEIEEADAKLKCILFGLCHFHAIMIERKKFGPKGFNMMYPFSLGDLHSSWVCLNNYMENAGSKIPWEDLRYIFGQIMYGGHIVNDLDRLLCVTYLEHFLRDELLDEMELFPFVSDEKASFKTPGAVSYERYMEHIEEQLQGDTPLAFGLHPNAEIGFRTAQSELLFRTLQDLQPADAGDSEEGMSPQAVAENYLNDILDRFGEPKFDLDDIASSIEDNRGPFQNVFFLEVKQMEKLLAHMRKSLKELRLGFGGELTMSEEMENLQTSLFMDRVPKLWAKLAWPSLRPLASWLTDLNRRVEQLLVWVGAPLDVPNITWLSGLINPQSFLTAVMQQTAQRNQLEMDKLFIYTEVTKKMSGEMDSASRDGAFIDGMFLQGARWDVKGGVVEKSKPREMYCVMPIVNCRAVGLERQDEKGVYKCPVYKTEQRGPTFVFRAMLKSKSPPARWLFAAVAIVLDLVL